MGARRLRLGMVGGGATSTIGETHRIAARFHDRYALVAGALDADAAAGRVFAAELGIAADRIYDDFAAMAAAELERDDGIEVVSILTPNNTHHRICRAFIDRGFHVICEKPLCTSLDDALDLVRAVREAGVVFGLTHPYTKAGMVDAEEDERWGEDFRGDELPEELQRREKRLAAIQAAKARLEAAQRGRDDERGREPGQDRNPRGGRPYKRAYGEPEPKAQSNFTDPESQIMKTSSEGFQQCYNAQMAVDGEHQIIVATQVGPQASDQGQLVGMLDEINETFGVEPAVVLADAGYCNEPDLLELEDRGIDAHVALGREGKSQVAVDPARLPATHRMGEKLASPAGKARYAQRKWLSEAPNGWIKEVLGFRRFSLRGLAKVRGEWDLVCLALNIKRMGTVATC